MQVTPTSYSFFFSTNMFESTLLYSLESIEYQKLPVDVGDSKM
jgi:hypothetical protein